VRKKRRRSTLPVEKTPLGREAPFQGDKRITGSLASEQKIEVGKLTKRGRNFLFYRRIRSRGLEGKQDGWRKILLKGRGSFHLLTG